METKELTQTARLHNWDTQKIEAAIEWTKERYNNYRTKKRTDNIVEIYGMNKK